MSRHSKQTLGIENAFILRLPQDHADRVNEAIRTEALRDRLKIEFYGDQRHARVVFDEDELSGMLKDLPCIIESHKTLDNKTLYKTGDIAQMLYCTEEPVEMPQQRIDELPLAKRKEMAKKFNWTHGITPPLKNVKKRRFRKTAPKKFIDSPEIEKELRRLLREDIKAVNVVADENKQEDSQSILSGGTSRAQTPAIPPDEDSMISDDAAKSELLRVLEEASSSSSDDDDDIIVESDRDDDGDEDEDEDSMNPEVLLLQQAIQDIDMQIEEQKLKIQATANPNLRDRFESFLEELEKHRQEKLDELRSL